MRRRVDMIEDVEVEVDVDDSDEWHPRPVCYLKLQGDFSNVVEDWFAADIAEQDPNTLLFDLPRNIAEKLHKQLSNILSD